MLTRLRGVPPILYGALLLATLSLIWSGYAITDVMDSGRFGLSVAVAGDIGWLTIMWAEYQRFGGRPVIAAGWLIAAGASALLLIHGIDERSVAQSIAGPFVVLVAKTVGTITLLALRDPAALTAVQEAEINDVIREGERTARLNQAHRINAQLAADGEIERIRQEARITAAQDRADFDNARERIKMHAEIQRLSPWTLSHMSHPAQPLEPPTEPAEPTPLSPVEPPVSAQVTPPEPQAPTPPTFGFAATATAQQAQRLAAVRKVAELLAQDPGITAAQVEEQLSVSPATAKRYLREARRGGQ